MILMMNSLVENILSLFIIDRNSYYGILRPFDLGYNDDRFPHSCKQFDGDLEDVLCMLFDTGRDDTGIC